MDDAEDDFDQRLVWFKRTEVPAEVPRWLSLPMDAVTPTEQCRDAAMTSACSIASLGSMNDGYGGSNAMYPV